MEFANANERKNASNYKAIIQVERIWTWEMGKMERCNGRQGQLPLDKMNLTILICPPPASSDYSWLLNNMGLNRGPFIGRFV